MKTTEYQRAQDLYLSSQGHISYSELAAQVGVSKKTVCRWASKHQWRQKVAALAEEVQRKVSEKLAESLSQRAAALAEQSLEPLERISHLVNRRLDNPTLDTEQLRPGDLRALALAQDSVIKNARLISGQPTERQELSGKVSLDIEVPGYIDEVIQRIIQTGDPEGQVKLMRLQEALQALIETP